MLMCQDHLVSQRKVGMGILCLLLRLLHNSPLPIPRHKNQISFLFIIPNISSPVCSAKHFLWLFVRIKQIHLLLHATSNTTIFQVVLLHANDSAY